LPDIQSALSFIFVTVSPDKLKSYPVDFQKPPHPKAGSIHLEITRQTTLNLGEQASFFSSAQKLAAACPDNSLPPCRSIFI
jgi:hypothetical protein